eukprot:9776583-Alexandrium_andersonii.AAC.1
MTCGLEDPGHDRPSGARDTPTRGLPADVELQATERLDHRVGGAIQDGAPTAAEVHDQAGCVGGSQDRQTGGPKAQGRAGEQRDVVNKRRRR